MKKAVSVLFVAAIFGLALVANSYAMGSKPKPESTAMYNDVKDLIGTEVKNPAGETLGSISDFVSDQKGHVMFAVLSHENKFTAIPFSALSISGTKPGETSILLDADRQKIEGAPEFDATKAVRDRKWAEEVYRYFGQQPFWTEQEAQPATVPGSGGVGY